VKGILIGLGLAAVVLTPRAEAQEVESALSQCIATHARPKDRTVLARWLMATLAMDTAVADMAKVTPDSRRQLNEQYAAIVQDVFTKRCRQEAVAALRQDGVSAFDNSFATVMETTLAEFVGTSVTMQVEQIGRAMDTDAITAVFAEAGIPPPPPAK
jgi:hypothetical protein